MKTIDPLGITKGMYDPRLIMGMVHRYGEAVREGDLPAVGLLYSEIVRALDEHEGTPEPSEEDSGAIVRLAG